MTTRHTNVLGPMFMAGNVAYPYELRVYPYDMFDSIINPSPFSDLRSITEGAHGEYEP